MGSFEFIWGKINAININVVLRIIYLLRAIPFHIPYSYIHKFYDLFWKLLWGFVGPAASIV